MQGLIKNEIGKGSIIEMKAFEVFKKEFIGIRDDIKEVYQREWIYLIVLFVFAIFTYFIMLTQDLTNTFDGLWTGNYYRAGSVEMGSGRWFWPYVDLLHFAVQSRPINVMITLLMICTGLTLVKSQFPAKSKVCGYLAGLAYLGNVAVCVALSYSYMSPVNGLGFLLGIFSAYIVIQSRNALTGILYASIPLAFSLGLYQTYIENTAVILLIYMLYMICVGDDLKKLRDYIIKSIGTVIGGAVLYRILLELHLRVLGLELSTYKGANTVSVSKMLKTLPYNLIRTYKEWISYFCNNKFAHNMFQEKLPIFYAAVFLFLAIILIGITIGILKRGKFIETVLFVSAVLVIPVAASFILLITTEADVQIQMTNGFALVLPGYMYLFGAIAEKEQGRSIRRKTIGTLWLLVCVAIAYGNFYMTIVDQEVMRDSKKATTIISDSILEDLKSYGYFTNKKPIAIVGQATASKVYKRSALYGQSNIYARIGLFWKPAACMRMSWEGVFRDYTPCELTFCDDERYDEIIKDSKFEDMPLFPESGYIADFGDTIVVKVSDEY